MFRTISKSPVNPSSPPSFSSKEKTNTKITYDNLGKVISSTYLRPTDIPNLSISQITGLQDALDALAPVDSLPSALLNDILYYNGTEWVGGSYTTIGNILQLGTAAYFNYGDFLTSEADPIFQASPANTISLTDIANWNAGALGGTVTSFSAGNLSPLFTTSVATATSTPALSFSLSNAAANTYLGNATGSPAAPSYTSAAALTKVDDTNVTLTLGGSPTTALLTAASITAGWTGQLAVSRGGLGLSTTAQGDLIYGSAADTYSLLSKDTNATRYLSNTGTSNNPAWAQVNLANGVTGDLPFANLTQIAGLSVLGVTGSSTADVAGITAGSDFQVLRRSGSAVAFGSVNLASTNAVTGTLPGGNGGTGTTSFGAQYRVPVASSTTVLTTDSTFTYNYSTDRLGAGTAASVTAGADLNGYILLSNTATLTATFRQLRINGSPTTATNNVNYQPLYIPAVISNDGTPTGGQFQGILIEPTIASPTRLSTAQGLAVTLTNNSANVDSTLYGARVSVTDNTTTSTLDNRTALSFDANKGGDAVDMHTGRGVQGRVRDTSATGRWSSGIGADLQVQQALTGRGAYITVSNSRGTGNTQYGADIITSTSGAGVTTTNAYGIQLAHSTSGGATISTYYGLATTSTPAASTNYFLYASGSSWRNYINGNLALGTDDNSSRLFLRGSGTTSSTYSIFAENSSGTDYFKLNDAGQLYLGSSTPNAAALLQVDSTTKGFLPPRMTTAERDAISSPPAGLVIYNTTTNKLNVYTTAWEAVTSA